MAQTPTVLKIRTEEVKQSLHYFEHIKNHIKLIVDVAGIKNYLMSKQHRSYHLQDFFKIQYSKVMPISCPEYINKNKHSVF